MIDPEKFYKPEQLRKAHPFYGSLSYYWLLEMIKTKRLKAYNANTKPTKISRFIILGKDAEEFAESLTQIG